MNEALLVASVRRFPLLYDCSHPEYSDNGKKAEAWSEIASVVGLDAQKCKGRWNSMRDVYRRSVKRNKMRLQNGLKPMPNKHEDRLYFLQPFLRPYEDDSDHSRTKEEALEEELIEESWSEGQEDTNSDRTMEYFDDTHVPQVTMTFPTDPIDAFMGAIGAMLKPLPLHYQSKAKAEIFAAAHKYELLSVTEKPDGAAGGSQGLESAYKGSKGPGGAAGGPEKPEAKSVLNVCVKEEYDGSDG